jgi:hypothetical protein
MQERNISTITLRSPFDVSDIKIKSPYACLIYSTQKDVTDEEMQQVSDWIISSGCRYAVCAGIKCSEWHDSIDWSYIASDPNYSPPDSRFIMTSWHTDESIEEVVWFWLVLTNYDDNIFENFLLLIIGDSEDIERKIMKAASEIDL